jgi:hypothetical protein
LHPGFLFLFSGSSDILQRLFLLRECGNLLVNVIKVRYPISSATAPEGTQYPLLNDKRILASLCLTL